MPEPQKRPAGPPHNPGVRNLVANLRRHHTHQTPEMASSGFLGWHERGYLPHYDVPNVTQFVTFRLADSLPAEVQARLATMPDKKERRRALERALDQGHGACWLRRDDLAALVENALRFFHARRYVLLAWCVMPNHVHVLLHVTDSPLAEITESWKSFTGLQANRILGREGQAFWQEDYFDTTMRDAAQEKEVVRYIEQNPSKAKFVTDPREWPWSSARLRDSYERLSLEPGAGKPRPANAGAFPENPPAAANGLECFTALELTTRCGQDGRAPTAPAARHPNDL